MSSLIFFTTPQEALVATDTLGVYADDYTPALFTTKAHYVPHLRMIIAGTGLGGFADDWWLKINKSMLVQGMEHLDEYTTSALRKLWEANSAHALCEDVTTTVYHIGYSEQSGEVTTFAYRSSSNFASERLQHGFAVKPECVVPAGDDILALIEPTMEEQRRTQAKVAPEKRIHIGGEAFAMHLTDQGCNTFRLFRFPDYEAQMEHALRSSMRNKFGGYF